MAIPILAYRVRKGNGGHPQMDRLPENAGETALTGVPVLMTAGMVGESPTINDGNDLILGFSSEFFHNLTTDNTPKELTYGAVQGQTAAVLIPVGAPPSDGKVGVLIADDDTEFIGEMDDDESLAITDVGNIYGLTKHANGFWHVDKTITTTGAGACVKITELVDDPGTNGGKVAFQVLRARQQFHA